ncbi:MAG: DUF3369 domain-containing protein [Oscillospiraceae bacterium]|nr:DUF3369 domain-containing protein [Oscillospiraceae bacterium]
MRLQKKKAALLSGYKLMMVDDDEGLLDSVSGFLERNGYEIFGLSSPIEGLETLKKDKYDILILDYFMSPIKGDDFVSKLREFDQDLYVILLTGHKDLAPPLETIRAFDIQAYCEKSPRLDQLLLLIESGVKSINQMRKIKKYRDGLDNILTILPKIYQLNPLTDILDAILSQALNLTQSNNALILIDGINWEEQSMYKGVGEFAVLMGTHFHNLAHSILEAIGQSKISHTAVTIEDGIVLPLIGINDPVLGVIYIAGKVEDEDNTNLLKIFVNQAAVAIQNAHLHSLMNKQADELTLAYAALKASYVETIEALRLAVDTKDVYTRGHSDRVSMYACLIGEKLGIKGQDIEDLRIGGLFHDIGKIGINDDILLKKTGLSDGEYQKVKNHTVKGATILSAISAFVKIKSIVRSHHERLDGLGYPDGLKGDEIPYNAKIICVADSYDAMTSDRQYRRKFNMEGALEQLKVGRGTQFDRDIVDCFISIINEDSEEVNMIFNYM